MRILILGVSGMLGSTLFKEFSNVKTLDVFGTARSGQLTKYFDPAASEKIIYGIDVLDNDSLTRVLSTVRPSVVVNCVGLVKQLSDSKDPLIALPLNSMLPHRLSQLCSLLGARLIHISTDCVFSGVKGNYLESDLSDAEDLYGKSKYIGELHDDPHAVTIRTSIIGHELNGHRSLIDWFLAQQGSVKGFRKAIFSGLPTAEMARMIRDYVLPNPQLSGLYHVSAKTINKYDLLKLVAGVYGKDIEIKPDENLKIDRSLDSTRFTKATGYVAPEWPELIQTMFQSQWNLKS